MKETYNYYDAIRKDIKEILEDNSWCYNFYDEIEDLYEQIYNDLWTCDSVTGNGSGSYTFNSYEASENLKGNETILIDALREFGYDALPFEFLEDPEKCDVTIRCYLLSSILWEVLEEMKENLEEEEK